MKENPLPKAKFIFSYQNRRLEKKVPELNVVSGDLKQSRNVFKKHPHILTSCAVCFASQGHILKLTHSY